MYALAATYVQLRFGKHPFIDDADESLDSDARRRAILQRQREGISPDILAKLDPTEAKAIRWALAPDAKDRPHIPVVAWVDILAGNDKLIVIRTRTWVVATILLALALTGLGLLGVSRFLPEPTAGESRPQVELTQDDKAVGKGADSSQVAPPAQEIRAVVKTAEAALRGLDSRYREDGVKSLLDGLPEDLDAKDIALLAGDTTDISYRPGILELLVKRAKLRSLDPQDVPLVLDHATGSYREDCIFFIAPNIRPPITGTQAVAILGSESDFNRLMCLTPIAPLLRKPLSDSEVQSILGGLSQPCRRLAIRYIFKPTGDGASSLLMEKYLAHGEVTVEDTVRALGPDIVRGLGSKDRTLRIEVGQWLIEIGEPAVNLLIEKGLGSENAEARLYAKYVLAHIGRPAKQALTKALNHPDPKVAEGRGTP